MSLIIKTERIELKKFSKNDINLLFELDGDSDVMRYITLGKAKTIDEVKKESMPRILKSYTNGINYGIFPAYLQSNNTYIGWFQFEKDKHIRVKRNRYKYQKALDEGKDPNEVLKRSQSELNIEKRAREASDERTCQSCDP